MRYLRIREGVFLERPNRFVAMVDFEGAVERCHVKNTGRCRELLVPGARVFLEESENPKRATRYDLVAVCKGDRLINMDSQAPNRAAGEWLAAGGLGFVPRVLRPEVRFENSRFDFYWEDDTRRGFVEVKGVTLEDDGVVLFPDAPTLRGVKHLEELGRCVALGYEAAVLFVVQMEGVRYFTPNRETHPEFAAALAQAAARGVRVLAVDCRVTPEEMTLRRAVSIKL